MSDGLVSELICTAIQVLLQLVIVEVLVSLYLKAMLHTVRASVKCHNQ